MAPKKNDQDQDQGNGEVTIESLQAQLEASINDVKIQVDARQADKEAFDEKEAEYQEEIKSLGGQVASLNEENKALEQVNDELTKKLEEVGGPKTVEAAVEKIAEKKPLKIPTEAFEVDGQKYRFISPVFMFKKDRIVATDVINDMAKLAELVSAGVGSIQKV